MGCEVDATRDDSFPTGVRVAAPDGEQGVCCSQLERVLQEVCAFHEDDACWGSDWPRPAGLHGSSDRRED
jgi:hypothetical protein